MKRHVASCLFLLMVSSTPAWCQSGTGDSAQPATAAPAPIRRGGFIKRLPTDVPTQLQVQRQWRQSSSSTAVPTRRTVSDKLTRFQTQPLQSPSSSVPAASASTARSTLGQPTKPLLKPGEAEKILSKKAHDYRMQTPGFVDHPRNLPKDGEPASLKDALKRRAEENKTNAATQ